MRIPQLKTCLLPCLLMAAFYTPSDALATDYFVRKTGNNRNAGTSAATAWLTVDYGADQLVAGDTLYIGAGTYTEQVQPAATCSGTAVNPILFIADTDGSHTGDAGTVEIVAASWIALYLDATVHDYLEFYGFKITGGTGNAIQSKDSTGIVFDNCEVSGAGGSALRFDAYEVTIRNCSFHDNTGAGIYMLNGTVTIEDTAIYANLSLAGLFISTSSNITVTRCHIYGNSGHGVQLLTGSSASFANCLVAGNKLFGVFSSSTPSDTFDMQNCTVVNNGAFGLSLTLGTNAVTNCIFANNTSGGFSDSSRSTRLNNLLYGNGSGNTAANATEIVADPQFVGGGYQIPSTSPAANAGTDMTGMVDDDITGRPRPYNGAWDIGCYEEGPAGHYKLDETTGTVAADSSGFGRDGTHVNGPVLGDPGVHSNATTFNASDTDDRTDLPIELLDGAMDASVTFWVKTTKTGTQTILGAANSSVGAANEFVVYFHNNTTIRPYLRNSHVDFSVPSIADGQWHHFVCTLEGSTNTFTTYHNGESLGSQVVTGTTGLPLAVDTGGLLIGQEQDSVGGGFNPAQVLDGSLDDLRIYTRVLSDAEIALLADNSALVGHWKLDETSGTVAVDSSANGNDGTYTNGPSLGASGAYPGEVLTAADFDGVDDHVDLPDMNIDFSQGFSIALWVKPTDTPGVGQFNAFLDLSNGANVDEISLGMVGGAVGFQLYMTDTDDGSTLKTIEDNTAFEAGKWVHCVATVDAAGNAILYRNGEVTKSGFYTSIPTNVLRTQNSLATSPLNDEFPGTMDDVRFYNRSLSATEVSELYGLTGHWKMDEGSGSTAADSTAFANDATLFGATWTTDCAGNSGLEFDGISDTASTNADFDPPERGAIAMWFRSDGPPTSRQRPWGVGSDFEMWQDPDGFVSCDVSTDGFQGGFITTTPLHMDGRWYHFIAEYDSDDDSYAIYINGELHKSGISTWAMTKQAANTLTFGTRTGIAQYFEGGIRDFRIYNRSLTNSEKSELSGLVGYWKLDETSGTVAADSSAAGNDGTYTGGVLLNQTGTIDQAADFDGADDYVTVPDDSTLQMDDAFSISGWIRPDTSSNVDQMVLNKEGEYEIALSPSDELKWGITNTDPGWSWHGTGHIVAIGKWTHIALTYDNGTVSTYANGILVDTYNGSGTIGDQYTLLNELRIGGRSNNPSGKYFDGLIDDLRLFNRTLCPIEIYGQYKNGRPSGIRILKWVEVR